MDLLLNRITMSLMWRHCNGSNEISQIARFKGPTWVLSSAPDGPHVGPMNLAIRDVDKSQGSHTHKRWRGATVCLTISACSSNRMAHDMCSLSFILTLVILLDNFDGLVQGCSNWSACNSVVQGCCTRSQIDGLVQDCSNSNALAMESL